MKLYFTLNFWKDLWIWLNLFNKSFCLCPLICLFLTLQIYFIRFSMNVYTSMFYYRSWWAQVDSNHRPRAYQARALTTWAMSPFSFLRCISSHSRSLTFRSWWRWWESNPWPPACRAGALPAELHPHSGLFKWIVNSEEWKVKSFHLSFLLLRYSLFSVTYGHSKLNNNRFILCSSVLSSSVKFTSFFIWYFRTYWFWSISKLTSCR